MASNFSLWSTFISDVERRRVLHNLTGIISVLVFCESFEADISRDDIPSEDFSFNMTTIKSWFHPIIGTRHDENKKSSCERWFRCSEEASSMYRLLGVSIYPTLTSLFDPFTEDSLYVIAGLTSILFLIILHWIVSSSFRRISISEASVLKKALQDYLLNKAVTVVAIRERCGVKTILSFANWYLALGIILSTTQYYKMKLEHMIEANQVRRSSLVNIGLRIGSLLCLSTMFLIFVIAYGISNQSLFKPFTIFLMADTTYILVYSLAVAVKLSIFIYDHNCVCAWDRKASAFYHADMIFQFGMLTLDFFHTLYLFFLYPLFKWTLAVFFARALILISELMLKYRQYQNYRQVSEMMENMFPKASRKDIEDNKDDCAICWEPMRSAKKLPCNHLFHGACLRPWIGQETSCPICRKGFNIDIQSDPGNMIRRLEDPRPWYVRMIGSQESTANVRNYQRSLESAQILRDLQYPYIRNGGQIYVHQSSQVRVLRWPPEYNSLY